MIDMRQKGGRFFTFALWVVGPAVWAMTAVFLANAFGYVEIVPDYQSFGFGVAALLTALGLGSGANKYGSAQQARYGKSDGEIVL